MREARPPRGHKLTTMLASFAALSACDVAPNQPTSNKPAERQPLDGYSAIKFGTSLWKRWGAWAASASIHRA